LITEPSASANVLMARLAATVPDAHASKAQLQTLQCRVKAWRIERAKELILGGLEKSADMPVDERKQPRKIWRQRGTRRFACGKP
jgi:hypothetical protein